MSYSITYGSGVERDIAKLPKALLRRVDRAIMGLSENPRPPGCKKLAGQGKLCRIRVGDWRIVYEVDDARRAVDVQIVADRKDVYRGL